MHAREEIGGPFMASTTPLGVSHSRTNIHLTNFILPARHVRVPFDFGKARITAIVPTYKPKALTVRLIQDLLRSSERMHVYVVDDCTPQKDGSDMIFKRIQTMSKRVTLLRTPGNMLKAGALNYALSYIHAKGRDAPDVVLTLDDDVVIAANTVKNLVTELMSTPELGAACSQCRVLNKNKNFLTRLQGLEYLGFNAIRMADEGFFRGPLVMHGMLTAFRAEALREAQGFEEGHLIEDYEITTRLKGRGWGVKLAVNAPAWTNVPETFSALWRQRTRWLYGGIVVVAQTKHFLAVLQDLIGHGAFFATIFAIDLLIIVKGEGYFSPFIAQWIIALSLLQFFMWYAFQTWLMRMYEEKDGYDWALRLAILPEFIYSNLLTVVQIGAYFFLFFNIVKRMLKETSNHVLRNLFALITRGFHICGYTERWGTRTQ